MSNERDCQCGQAHGACAFEFQYAVKLVCGQVANLKGAPKPVAPGRYWTAINIHNPDKCHEAHFRWKVVVAAPLGQTSAVPVYQRPRVLGPDLALEIDCQQVSQTFQPPVPPFVKGYVVIESDIDLDVVAVYSGTQGGNTQLSSFHTERVQPRCVPVCEDLVLPLHTGFAGWQTVSPTGGPLGPVMPVNPLPPPPSWANPPFGSIWVSQTSNDGGETTSRGTRHYELCFDLCFGYTVPSPFQIQLLADDSATVLLNNNQVVNIPHPGYNTPTTLDVNPKFLKSGHNCFRIAVTNGPVPHGGPTGFALAGILHAVRGKCPCSPLPIAAKSPGATALEAQSVEPSENQGTRVDRTRKRKAKAGK